MKIRTELLGHYGCLLMAIWSDFNDAFDELGYRRRQYANFYILTNIVFLKFIMEAEGIDCSNDTDLQRLKYKFENSITYKKMEELYSGFDDEETVNEAITKIAKTFSLRATDDEFNFFTQKLLAVHLACERGNSMIQGFDFVDMYHSIRSFSEMVRLSKNT